MAGGGADVGEAEADAEGMAGRVFVEDEEGDGFAGVVGAGPGGIEAVVGGDDEEIAEIEEGEETGKMGIEFGESAGVADGVAAVAIEHVEFDEVEEIEAGGAGGEFGGEELHAVLVGGGAERAGDT